MPLGPYATRMRALIGVGAGEDRRVILDFWANDINLGFGDGLASTYLENPGIFTACHNVASTLVNKIGTGALTTLETEDDDDFAPAVAALRNGSCIMEIKFGDDHSVCVIARDGETHVEHLEAWAGAGVAVGSVESYLFTRSLFTDYFACRPSRGEAADALANLAANQEVRDSVQALTRCRAEACGIARDPFKLTVRYKALRNINSWHTNAKKEVADYRKKLSEVIYRADHNEPHKLRCRGCFKKKGRGRATWYHCDRCDEVYCDRCAPLPVRGSEIRRGNRRHELEAL